MKRIVFIWMLVVSSLCVAQRSLTLKECIELAKRNNKKIESSQLKFEIAKYKKREATSNFLPKFSIIGTGLYSTIDGALTIKDALLPILTMDGVSMATNAYFPGINIGYDIDWVYNAGVKVQQPIFSGGRIAAGYKLSLVGESIALQSKRLTEAEVILETAKAYAYLVRADEMCKVATSYNELLKELMRSVEKAMNKGVKSRNEFLKVEVKANESELNLYRAENALRLATMNLCHCIGVPLNTTIDVSLLLPTVNYEVSKLVDIDLRPEVQILAEKSRAMNLRVKMERAEMLPQIALVGQYGYMYGVKFAGKNLFNKWNFMAGFQISIPIVSLASFSKYRSAQMQYKQVQIEEKEKVELMILEAQQTANNLDEANREVRLTEKALVSATENLRVSSSQYRVGVETLSDYLEAQTLWLQAEERLVDARINQFLRWIEHCKVIGKLD